jgi:DNA-binding NarL/FixJ family response regulator
VIRVVVVDDEPLVRLGLRVLIDTEEDMTFAGEAGDGRAAVVVARNARPDVVLMDIRMPVMDGLDALREIVADLTLVDTKVVVLTTFALDEYVFEALRLGASGFLIKDTDPAELVRAIRVVARGDALLSPAVTRQMIDLFVSRPIRPAGPRPNIHLLTERERQIVALVAAGLSNEEIAARLVVSPATARTHVSRAMVKLHARDRAQLVVLAFQAGLVARWGD